MALRTLPIAAELLNFVAAGPCEPVAVWEERDGRRTLTDKQETDPETGEPLWTAFVMPTTAERPEVIQVRVRARQQPVVTQFGAVALDNLEASVRVDKAGKLAQYWSASNIRDAGNGHRKPHEQHKNGEQKPEGQ
ncbi:hypothetical protein ACFPK1_18875 [Actinomycetospora rhizophila]|uniref:Uncharacterized protein n=1 Tax=Actinomycetospora rhizophila TaxID=1416876 RepID=A0ABV9ZIA2_9PSEU